MVNLKDSNGRSLYFTNRKEYYRRKKISQGVRRYYAEEKKKVIYFVNFEIDQTRGYVVGSLSSPRKIPLTDAKRIIRANIPKDYIPIKFYLAEEKGNQTKTEITLLRDDNEIYHGVLNV